MATVDQRLTDPEYRNWVKAGLCLNIFKRGVQQFAEDESRVLHQTILGAVSGPSAGAAAPPVCGVCSNTGILKSRRWNIACPHNICNRYLKEILRYHHNPVSNKISWSNGDVQDWSHDHWSVAKLYMSPGQGQNKCAADCDASALLNFFINCTWFSGGVPGITAKFHNIHKCEDVRRRRNDIIHSGDMKCSDSDLTDFTDGIIGVLEDPLILNHRQEAKDAVLEVKKVLAADCHISFSDANKVMQQTLNEITSKLSSLEATTGSLDKELTKEKDALSNLKQKILQLPQQVRSLKRKVTNAEQLVQKQVKKTKVVVDRVTDVERKVAGHEKKIEATTSRVEDVEGKVAGHEKTIESTTSRITDVEGKVAGHEKKIEATTSRVEDVEGKVAGHGKKIEATTSRIEDVEGKVACHEKKIEATTSRVEDVEGKVAGHGKEIEATASRVTDVEGQVTGHEKTIESTTSRITDVEGTVAGYEKKIEATTSRVEDVEGKVACHEKKIEATTNLVEDVEGKVAGHEKKIEATTSRFTDFERMMKATEQTVQDEVKKIEASVSRIPDVEDRVAATEHVCAELQDSVSNIKLAMSTPSEDNTKAAQLEKDIQEFKKTLLEAYQESFTEITASPLSGGSKVPVDKVFSEVVIVEDMTLKRDGGAIRTEDRTEEKEIVVNSYHNMFYRGNKRLKSLFFLGEAGTGKTFYSFRMINSWLNAHTKLFEGKKKSDLKGDEAAMSEFQFLFYVPLRNMSNTDSLKATIVKSMETFPNHKVVVNHILQNCARDVLIICDGLDEFEGLVKLPQFCQYTILTTTRPWKFSEVQKAGLQVDRILKLKGLDDTGVSNLIKATLQCNDVQSDEVETISTDIRKVMVGEAIKVPLIVICLVYLRCHHKHLPLTVTDNMIEIIQLVVERGLDRLKSLKPSVDIVQGRFDIVLSEVECFPENSVFMSYGKLLLRVAELALDSLTNPVQEHALVFEEKTKLHFTSEEDLKLCLDLGIMCKTEILQHFICKKHNLSFPHKLFQEFFAALCIVNSENARRKFTEYCCSLQRVLDMGNVMMFVCGLSAEVGSLLSKHVMEVCSTQPEVLDFRTVMESEHDGDVNNLTKMYMRCASEIHGEKCELYMSDMYILDDPIDVCTVVKLLQFNVDRLVSVQVQLRLVYNLSDVSVDVVLLLQQLQTVTTLQRLGLDFGSWERTDVSIIMPSVSKVVEVNPGLKVLQLYLGYNRPLSGLCLPPLSHLQQLCLHRFPTTTTFLHQLSTVLAQGQLRYLELWRTDVGDCDLDMSQLSHLTELRLVFMTMSCQVWCRLLQSLNTAQSLHTLKLGSNTVTGDSSVVNVKEVNVQFIKQLKTLHLQDIHKSSSQILLNQILLSQLSTAVTLETLFIGSPGTECAPYIVSAIPHLQQLQELTLLSIDFQDKLTLQHNTKLRKVKLWFASMSPSAWKCLLLSTHTLQHLCELQLSDIAATKENIVKYIPPYMVTEEIAEEMVVTEESIGRRLTFKCKCI